MKPLKKMQIAITGGVGTGKSTLGQILRKRGFPCLDADDLAHAAIVKGKPAYQKVIQLFGKEILDSKGNIEHSKLAQLVFSNAEKRRSLEQIVHPAVGQAIAQALQNRSQTKFYLIPLLFESKLASLFDEVWVVTCSKEHQLLRLKKRETWSEQEIARRIAAQLPLSEKEKQADRVIPNDGSIQAVEIAVVAILRELGLSPNQEEKECNATI